MRGIFWGGLAGGLASVIPLVALMNCFCCLWAWAAGAVSAIVVRREGPPEEKEVPVTGALAGAFAGLVASMLQLVWTLVSGFSMSGMVDSLRDLVPTGIPEGSLEMLQSLPESGLAMVVMHLFSTLFMMGIFAGFGALGAMLHGRLTRPPRPPAAERPDPPVTIDEGDGTAQPE